MPKCNVSLQPSPNINVSEAAAYSSIGGSRINTYCVRS
jgi:hypothetical protein